MSPSLKPLALVAFLAVATGTVVTPAPAQRAAAPGHYATVNGLRLYYETYGPQTGVPVVLIHGALSNIPTSFGTMIPVLARTRRVIAIEYQAHGHTADIDRPLSTSQIADDVSELLRQLRIEQADLFGYSLGGLSALQFAVRHPDQLRRLVLLSSGLGQSSWDPQVKAFMDAIDPTNAPWAEYWRQEFLKYAPQPAQWPATLARVKQAFALSGDVSVAQAGAVAVPTLVISGDRDALPLEQVVLLYKSLPHGQLAVLPNTDHYPGVADKGAEIAAMVNTFLH